MSTTIMTQPLGHALRAHHSPGPWRAAWKRLRRNRAAMTALWMLGIMILLCIIGSVIFNSSQSNQNLTMVRQPPSLAHWFGTDALGRDVFQRVLCGGGISLLVGVVATLVAVIIGVAYGLISGLAGGWIDSFMMRIVDILYGFPFIAFVVLLNITVSDWAKKWITESSGLSMQTANEWLSQVQLLMLFAAIGAVEWLTTARVVRGQVLGTKNQEFVQASRTCGAGNLRILWHHLIPNIMGPVVIYASLTVPGIMLLEAVLSFLGLGVQPPNSSWGTLIQEGAANMETAPWLLAFPGAFFVTTLLALNLLGDALRDALDPKSLQ